MIRNLAIILLTLTSVASMGRDILSTKTLKMKGYTDGYSINIEYDSALLSFSIKDVRDELIKLKSKKIYKGQNFQNYFSETLKEISVNQDYLFKSKDNLSAGGIIEQYVLSILISKGKSKVFNKTTNTYVKKIKRTYYRFSLAGESHEGYEYAFMNGIVFLIDRKSI